MSLCGGRIEFAGRRQDRHSRRITDQRPLSGKILGAQKLLYRNIDRSRIGNERVAIAIGQPRRLDMPVSADDARSAVRRGGQPAEHAEDHQNKEALAIGRALVDVVTLPVQRNRLDEFSVV